MRVQLTDFAHPIAGFMENFTVILVRKHAIIRRHLCRYRSSIRIWSVYRDIPRSKHQSLHHFRVPAIVRICRQKVRDLPCRICSSHFGTVVIRVIGIGHSSRPVRIDSFLFLRIVAIRLMIKIVMRKIVDFRLSGTNPQIISIIALP